MAKATRGKKPAKAKRVGGARKAGARAGAKPRPAGKGKAPAKRFFAGKAPRPALGRKAPAPVRVARPGMKDASLRPRAERAPRKAAAPAPAAPPPPARPQAPDDGMLRARAAVAAAADKKAENPVILDVRGLSGVADYFVVLSAESDRQAAAVADAVDERLEGMGAVRLGTEGRAGGGWVLLDFGDVVIHVMSEESRGFYDLEGLWADAPRVSPA
jgi:ribosome-associated protein